MGAAKKFLETIAKPAPIESLEDEKYRNKSIVYDLAVLRHRGISCCDVETIARLQNDDDQPVPPELWRPLVDYVLRWANKIAACVREVTFVLDGESLLSKSTEAERRRTKRMRFFSKATTHQKKREQDGIDVDGKELRKIFARAVDASIDVVMHAIIEAMSDGPWHFIQAPNEADAQLAKLAPSVDLVVCNDSDLIVYGCAVVMVIKTDGRGVLKGSMYVIAEAVRNERHIFFGLSRGQLIAVCLVVGCDFSAGIFKIGWKKAPKLVRENWDESDPYNIERLIAAAESVGGAVVPRDFQQQWNRGWATFNYQRAFDPATGTIQYLHEPAPEMEEDIARLVGHPVRDVKISKAVAYGFLHPSMRPWEEVVAAIEDVVQLEAKAQIISRERESIARELDQINERQRRGLSNTFRHALKELELAIKRRRDANRLDPVVVDWEQKEKEFQSNREAYCRIIEQEGLPPVDEKHVIQWTVLALQRLQEDHGDGFSLYALKAMPDERDVPLRNEDTSYVTDTSRNPTVTRPVYIDEADDGAGTDTAREEAAIIGGRHFRTSEIVRYGEHASLDTSGMLVHRFLQYSTIFQGDAGAYLGELLATRVCFVMMGGGTGRVLNRAYFGRVQDPAGLKRHCFGISAIPNFVAGLEAGTMGICNSQQRPVLRQFCQNLACDFTLLSLVGKSRKRDRSNYKSELRKRFKSGEKLAPAEKALLDADNESRREKWREQYAKERAEVKRIDAKPEEDRLEEEQKTLDAAKAKRAQKKEAADEDRAKFLAAKAMETEADCIACRLGKQCRQHRQPKRDAYKNEPNDAAFRLAALKRAEPNPSKWMPMWREAKNELKLARTELKSEVDEDLRDVLTSRIEELKTKKADLAKLLGIH